MIIGSNNGYLIMGGLSSILLTTGYTSMGNNSHLLWVNKLIDFASWATTSLKNVLTHSNATKTLQT